MLRGGIALVLELTFLPRGNLRIRRNQGHLQFSWHLGTFPIGLLMSKKHPSKPIQIAPKSLPWSSKNLVYPTLPEDIAKKAWKDENFRISLKRGLESMADFQGTCEFWESEKPLEVGRDFGLDRSHPEICHKKHRFESQTPLFFDET